MVMYRRVEFSGFEKRTPAGQRWIVLVPTLAGDELDDPQQDAGTQQAGQEAEDLRVAALCTEQTENKTT